MSLSPRKIHYRSIYIVRLDYACATNHTLTDMRIRGSDLYTNYAMCLGTNQCSCCILHAAGAFGSVVDHILINITLPWTGTNITKTGLVVFRQEFYAEYSNNKEIIFGSVHLSPGSNLQLCQRKNLPGALRTAFESRIPLGPKGIMGGSWVTIGTSRYHIHR